MYSLEIREAEGSDGGKYTLTAHNSEGTIFSDVHVNVTVPTGEDDKIIMEGQNIRYCLSLLLLLSITVGQDNIAFRISVEPVILNRSKEKKLLDKSWCL